MNETRRLPVEGDFHPFQMFSFPFAHSQFQFTCPPFKEGINTLARLLHKSPWHLSCPIVDINEHATLSNRLKTVEILISLIDLLVGLYSLLTGRERATPPPSETWSWDVPLTVADFVGRKDAAKEVSRRLLSRTSFVISGLPGIGKTAIMNYSLRKLKYRIPRPYHRLSYAVMKSQETEEEQFNSLLMKLVTDLGIPLDGKSHAPEQLLYEARRLATTQRILFIIDNVDDERSRQAVQRIASELPRITLAVTSRKCPSNMVSHV